MRNARLGFGAWAWGLGLGVVLSTAACGARVVVDHETGEGGSGGGGGPATTTSSTTTSSSSTTTSTSTTSTTTTFTITTTTTFTTTETGGPNLVEVPLGTVSLGVPFTFEVPPDTLGFTLVAHPPGSTTSDKSLGIEKMWAPDGTQIVSNYSLGPENGLFFYANYGIVAAGVPQSDDAQSMPVQAGKWSAEIDDFLTGGPTTAEVSLWLRQTIDGQFHGGVLDVNVFSVNGVISQAQALEVLFNAYSDYVGLGLGSIHFYQLPDKYDVIDETNFYAALNETAVVPGKPALNILYVSLLTGQLEGAAGVSSGLPGVPVQHGTNASGIIAMYFADQFDSIVLQHEAGHFGGLFHTSEFEPGNGDFLGDTPLCEDVFAQFDSCPDFDNVMFPTGGLGLGFSPKQTRVLRGSALYRGIHQPGVAPNPPFVVAQGQGQGEGALPWLGSVDAADLHLDLAGRAAGGTARTSPAEAAWAAGLPPGAAAALAGLSCAHGAGGLSAGWGATLAAVAPVPDAILLDLATDTSAPNQVRARALQALGARPSAGALAGAAADIAASETAPAAVRIAAIRLASRGPAAARAALKSRLGAAPPPVARVAMRLL